MIGFIKHSSNGPVVDYVGLPSSPEFRYKFDVGYDVPMVQDLRVGVEYEYIDSYANNTDADYNPVGEVDSSPKHKCSETAKH